jgi:hypothetical protein
MPDAPVSLLDQFRSNPFQGIESLLAPIVSGGAIAPPPGQAMTPFQQGAAEPALLAFAQRMANAGAPTLGPPPTMAQALTGAMGSGYNAAVQAQMLPYLQASAAREAMGQDIELQQAQIRLQRTKDILSLQHNLDASLSGLGAGQPGARPAPVVAQPAQPAGGIGSGNEAAATSDAIAALPDVQRLPEATRGPFIAGAVNANMGANTAANYARMVLAESNGVHIDPQTNAPLQSTAGAIGGAQVMPDTFGEMVKKYNISGDINDVNANLAAGAHYYADQVKANGGNLADGAIAYNAGPAKLADYKAGKAALPDETQRYLIKTGSPAPSAPGVPAPGQAMTVNIDGKPVAVSLAAAPDAGPGGGFPPAQGAGGPDTVRDPLSGMTVPRYILQSAAAAMRTQTDPDKALSAYQGVLTAYAQEHAHQTLVSPMTPDELKQLPPQIQSAGPLAKRNAAGELTGIELPAPRAVGMGFSQTNQIQSDMEKSPAYVWWVQSGPRYDAVMSALSLGTRAGSEAAAINLAKLFDPNVMAGDRSFESAVNYGGLPQQFKELLNKPMGADGYTDDVKRQLAELATAEMEQRDKSVFETVNRYRTYATGLKGQGIDVFPDVIGSGVSTKALTVDSPESQYAPAGIGFAKPLAEGRKDPNDPNSTLTFTREGGTVIRQPGSRPPPSTVAAPPAAKPAQPATQPGAGGKGFSSENDRFTAPALSGMSDEGLNNAYQALKLHPENFSQNDANLLAAEKRARAQKAGR